VTVLVGLLLGRFRLGFGWEVSSYAYRLVILGMRGWLIGDCLAG
jgi:hypothetical protein